MATAQEKIEALQRNDNYESATKEQLITRIRSLEDCLTVTITPFDEKEWASLGSYLAWKRGYIKKIVNQEFPFDTLRNLPCPPL